MTQRETYYLIAELKHSIYPKVLMLDSIEMEYQNKSLINSYHGNEQIEGFDLVAREPFNQLNFSKNSALDIIQEEFDRLQARHKSAAWKVIFHDLLSTFFIFLAQVLDFVS